MRQKIRYDLLLKSQKYSRLINHPIQYDLYRTAYKYINQLKSTITKPFSNVCIHGNYPELIIPLLNPNQNNKNKYNFWVHSFQASQKLAGQNNIKFLNSQVPFNQIKNQQKFDLIISCLQGHHYQMSNLFQNYLHKLNPDGAIIGCSWVENTLKQLKWAYMMAQNERYGGISPKIFGFPSLGMLGNYMTTANIKLPTIIVKDLEIQFDSVVDIITLMQIVGQSGSLHGRRKGCYKDLLLAASAYYDSQFSQTKQNQQPYVNLSLQMGLFVGWKQHDSQPKPLGRKQVINKSFFNQLIKQDKDSKMFLIDEGSEEPTEVDIKNIKENQPEPKK